MAVGNDGSIPDSLCVVPGIRLAVLSAGIKVAGRLDVVLFEICEGATTAGIYTLNSFCAAPVIVTKRHVLESTPRFFLINTGNANAGTGAPGEAAAIECCAGLGEQAGVLVSQVLPFSTGVIGEQLPTEKITSILPALLDNLNETAWLDAARGILTTDTRPKAFSQQIKIKNKTITITGIAKGAGMIKPNMATMLAYIFTDAALDQPLLQTLLKQANDHSFNRITVDGDTSTNDCCMLVATGKSNVTISNADEQELKVFISALGRVFNKLAQGLIRDAEGATKFVKVRVEAGLNSEECLQVAYTIAESPLVKTALFASDPNWGRILAAVGRAGVGELDIAAVEIYLNEVCIVEEGAIASAYTEAAGQAVMNQEEINITVKLGRGSAVDEVWTSDLSYDYIKINAEYRT